jgi:hypothetical protein
MASTTTTEPQSRPDIDRDPGYDELWAMVAKLDVLLGAAVASGLHIESALAATGHTAPEIAALRFDCRERAILVAVSRDRTPEPVPE